MMAHEQNMARDHSPAGDLLDDRMDDVVAFTGLVLMASILAGTIRRWSHGDRRRPRETAEMKLRQLREAIAAGTDAWRRAADTGASLDPAGADGGTEDPSGAGDGATGSRVGATSRSA